MRHRKAGIKLNRTSSHRNAMFRNMVTSLFKYEKIKTTDVKAKEVRRWADKLITLAKRGGLHARRQALSIIREKAVVHKLFEEASQKFGSVSGGYTRVVKMGFRSGDAASVSLVELVIPEEKPKKKKAAKKKSTATKPVKKQPKETVKKTAKPDDTGETAKETAAEIKTPLVEENNPTDEAKPENREEEKLDEKK